MHVRKRIRVLIPVGVALMALYVGLVINKNTHLKKNSTEDAPGDQKSPNSATYVIPSSRNLLALDTGKDAGASIRTDLSVQGNSLQNGHIWGRWSPKAPVMADPKTVTEIENVINNAIERLGYKSIASLELEAETTIVESSTGKLLKTRKSYESWEENWLRRELHDDGAPEFIEIIQDGIVLQKDPASSAVEDVLLTDTPWNNHTNHPLMLHHQLNPLIFEKLEVREFSADEASALGNESASGHQVAILTSPSVEPRPGQALWYEVCLDITNGQVLRYTTFHDGKELVRTTYRYEEIYPKVFIPVESTALLGDKYIEKRMISNIKVNQPLAPRNTSMAFHQN